MEPLATCVAPFSWPTKLDLGEPVCSNQLAKMGRQDPVRIGKCLPGGTGWDVDSWGGRNLERSARLRRVMRALMCSQYSEGVLRGGRAGERGSLGDREEEIRGGEPGAFTLGQNV